MSWFSNFLLLAADAEVEKSFMDFAPLTGVLLAIAVVPIVLSKVVSNALRMADYRWKIWLIFFTVLAGSVVVFLGVKYDAIRLAIDLKGGTRLIYEVDEEQRLRDGLDEAVIKIEQTFGTDEDDDELSVGSPAVGEIRIEVPAGDEELNQRIGAEVANLEIQGGSLVLTLDHVEDVGSMRHHIYKLVTVAEGSVQMDKLAAAVARRINPGGVLEIIIRPAGYGRLEIVIPVTADENQEEVDSIKRKISTAGVLVFRILADENNSEHDRAIRRAKDEEKRGNKDRDVRAGLRTIARWVEVDLQVGEEKQDGTVQIDLNNVLRTVGEKTEVLVIIDRYNVTGGYLASASSGMSSTSGLAVNFTFKPAGAKRFGKLTKDNLPDESVVPVRHSRLGIVLDGKLLSAPNINGVITDKGQITGQFDEESIDFLVGVLNAGSLPTALHKQPISEMKQSATQGADLIRRGLIAMAVSMVSVLVFMLVYYRFAGAVAAFALVLNLVLILALMITIKAAFSLAGIAGLVLTVGMAVDANVLIFERIREELNRGSALRLAIRNGFSRATRTIVDANLTTLIVAVVLYVIGQDQLKSFAVTLILGILLSMFTAIFCSRVIFDIAERKRWITQLNMMKLLGETKFDFIGKRRLAAVASSALIVLGLVAVVGRGAGLLDIDFTGGVSVQVQFKTPMEESKVREDIEKAKQAGDLPDATVAAVGDANEDGKYIAFKIDTSIHEERDGLTPQEQVRAVLINTFGNRLERYSMTTEDLKEVFELAEAPPITSPINPLNLVPGKPAEPADKTEPTDKTEPAEKTEPADAKPTDATKPAEQKPPAADDKKEKTPADDEGASALLPADSLIASTDAGAVLLAQVTETKDAPTAKAKQDVPVNPDPKTETKDAPKKKPPTDVTADPDPKTEAGDAPKAKPQAEPPFNPDPKVDPETAAPPKLRSSTVKLHFPMKISYDTLEEEIKSAMKKIQADEENTARKLIYDVSFTLSNKEYDAEGGKSHAYVDWQVEFFGLKKTEAGVVLDRIKSELATRPVFPSINDIGGQVAADTQTKAIAALFVSLLAIIGYIWLRFSKVMYGLAAVVALVHDVLITLGMIALSAYVVNLIPGGADLLLIDPFKISLPVLAAFLTIIGYSLNDTIVVFDRIREVKGRSPDLTAAMVNTSINQTLSRTLLTSLTTLLVVGILYWGGGQGIHGFAFSLLIGVMVGTYSSIYVASPVLLWMAKSAEAPQGRKTAKSEPAGV